MDNNSIMRTYAEQLRKAEQNYLSARITEEQKFQTWINGCKSLPEEITSKIPFDINTVTLQQLIPEWYNDDMNQEEASRQVANLNSTIEQVNQYVLALNERAIAMNDKMETLMGTKQNADNGI